MNILVRNAELSDAPAIWKLNYEEMGYDFPLDSTREKMAALLSSETDRIFVAINENTVVGYIHANSYDLLYAPHLKNIMGIAVCSKHKRMGVGTALLNQVEAWAKQDGAAGVRLVSGASRTEAHAFYHKCGFSGDKEQLNLKKMF